MSKTVSTYFKYRNILLYQHNFIAIAGIVCYDRLDDMLKLVNSQVVRKDNKYVVQKYMGRSETKQSAFNISNNGLSKYLLYQTVNLDTFLFTSAVKMYRELLL